MRWLNWLVAGVLIWLALTETLCLVCVGPPQHVDLAYSQHESAAGTTIRSHE